jgi:hypothetical protein
MIFSSNSILFYFPKVRVYFTLIEDASIKKTNLSFTQSTFVVELQKLVVLNLHTLYI